MSVCSIEREALSGVVVDLGGTKLAAGRFKRGALVDYEQVPTQGEGSVDQLVESVAWLTNRLKLEDSDSFAMAVTGRVDQQGSWYAVNTNTLAKISCVPLKQLLVQRFNRKVSVLNDATAGALGEYQFGAGAKCHRLAYITVSTGVGGGFVIDGLPLTSPRGMAGHVGFMSSRHATLPCGCGRTATVESIASGLAIARSAESAGHAVSSAKDVFDAHFQGCQWATDIINQSAIAIAELCLDLVALLDIERVLIGGSVGLAEGYCRLVRDAVEAQAVPFQVVVQPASLGRESVLLGALFHDFQCCSMSSMGV